MLTLEVLSLSIHYSISISTTYWWNLNKIAWSELYKLWVFWQKMFNCFFVCLFVCFFFFEIKFQNGAHLKKGLFLTYFSHFLVTRESYKNSFSTYLTHIHTRILLTLLTFFFALPILKKIRIYQVRFLFGMSPGVDSYSRHFGTIDK